MMDYIEIVNIIKSGGRVRTTDVSGIQLFMLLRDHVVEPLKISKIGTFELNFVPMDEAEMEVEPLRLNEDNCSNFFTAGVRLKELVKQYKNGDKVLYVAIEDETYELYVEELESDE